jgi:XapX domain-containing protein
MKPYLISLAAGLLAGCLYALLQVRSPAPPAIALIGLLGMLAGEQAVPFVRSLLPRAQAERSADHPVAGHDTQAPDAQPHPTLQGATFDDTRHR